MRHLLDTDAVAVFYDDHREPCHIHDRVASLSDEDVVQTSAIGLCELARSRTVEQDVLDLLDEPMTQ